MTISRKILSSYIILLIITFLIVIGITNTVVTNRLTKKAYEDLRVQSASVIELIESSRFELTEPRKMISYMRNSNVSGLVPADIFLLSSDRRIIYASNEEMPQDVLKDIVTKDNPNYLSVVKELVKDEEKNWLFTINN